MGRSSGHTQSMTQIAILKWMRSRIKCWCHCHWCHAQNISVDVEELDLDNGTEAVPHYWSDVRLNQRPTEDSLTKGQRCGVWWFRCCWLEWADKQTVALLVIWDVMTPTWRHCNEPDAQSSESARPVVEHMLSVNFLNLIIGPWEMW